MPKRLTKKSRAGRKHLAPDDHFAWKLKITTWDGGGRTPPQNLHLGVLLLDEFMKPLRLTPAMMAKAIPRHPEFLDSDMAEQIEELIRADEDSSLDLHLALALDRYFGLSPGFFWRAQAQQEIREWTHRERHWLASIKPIG